MKPKLKNKWEQYRPKEGTTNIMENEADKANQSRYEETDIKKIIEKYGILPFEILNSVKEPLFLDMRGDTLTLNEKLKQKQEIDKYFELLPAKIRKNYRDNKDYFYQYIIDGSFDQLIKDGIMTKEHAEEIRKYQQTNYQKLDEINENLRRLNYDKTKIMAETSNTISNVSSKIQDTNN